MTAKAALIKALLDGKVLNIKNCFNMIGLTNCPREISRCVEEPFEVTITRIHREGVSRYGTPVVWVDYVLERHKNSAENIQKMIDYVNKESAGFYKEKTSPKTTQEKLF